MVDGALARFDLSVKCETVTDVLCGAARASEFSLELLGVQLGKSPV